MRPARVGVPRPGGGRQLLRVRDRDRLRGARPLGARRRGLARSARNAERGEFYALAMFGAAGMALLGMATDLLVAFIAIEAMSLATYSLAAYLRRGKRPSEAAFKYLVLGAISSALLPLRLGAPVRRDRLDAVLGAARTGAARRSTSPASPSSPAGIAFKIAAVPFHAWTPDVYEGAPTPVTAFMAAGVKTAAFALLVRIFLSARRRRGAGDRALRDHRRPRGPDDDLRQPARAAAAQREADARVLLDRARGVPARRRGVGGRSRARARRRSPVLFYLAAYTRPRSARSRSSARSSGAVAADDEPRDAWDLERFAGSRAAARRSPSRWRCSCCRSRASRPPPASSGSSTSSRPAVGAELYGLAILGVADERARRVLLPPRRRLHVHARRRRARPRPLSTPAMTVALGGGRRRRGARHRRGSGRAARAGGERDPAVRSAAALAVPPRRARAARAAAPGAGARQRRRARRGRAARARRRRAGPRGGRRDRAGRPAAAAASSTASAPRRCASTRAVSVVAEGARRPAAPPAAA